MLHVEVLSAIVYDHASYDDQTGSVDPAVVLRGELPATARPFGVDRVYRGPNGSYDESWAILGPDGELVYQHDYARITLRGEMFEDRFRDVVKQPITFVSADEHTLVLLISDREVGRVPLFVDAPGSARAAGVLGDALEAALKKSAIIWVTIPQPSGASVTRPAWFTYQDGKVFVLTGPNEQDLTNIGATDQVTITARSSVTEIRARIAEVPASVRVVDNDSDEFVEVAQASLSSRLNMPDDGEAAFERWRSTCTLVELSPELS